MTPTNDNRSSQEPEKTSAYERLRKAARELEQAVIKQREQVKELQGNMNALDRSLTKVEESFVRAHQVLSLDSEADLAPAVT